MDQYEYMALEPFDREYGLADLLSVELAAGLLGDLYLYADTAVLFPDGRALYDRTQQARHWAGPALQAAGRHGRTGSCCDADGRKTMAFALTHEMETIGFFVIRETEKTPHGVLETIGGLALRSLRHMLHLTYKTLMTASLHGQVVEDSYARLKKKAALLQVSEAKYKTLAKNLEKEVARKTERIKQAQLTLLQQEKLAAVGQLAAGMAHEINNPIGFVISNLNTFAANTNDLCGVIEQYARLSDIWRQTDGGTSALKKMAAAAEKLDRLCRKLDVNYLMEDTRALVTESLEGAYRIKNIVQSLREFAHPSVDEPEAVDLNHCLDVTLSMLDSRIADGIEIARKYGATRLVTCHRRDINQVFFNVIHNALQAASPCGQIAIRTRDCEDGTVEVTVADTGAGIPEAHLSHIFDPFFTTRDVGSGTGLGLYLAFTLVKKHNGVISVESKEGAGSIFRIKLPAGKGPY